MKISKNLPFIILPTLLISCNSGSTAVNNSNQIQYTTINYPGASPTSVTGVTGIRQVGNTSDVYITGSYFESSNTGTLYKGPILGGGTYYTYMYPSASGATVSGTNVYGPNNSAISDNVQLVGTYATIESGGDHALGFLYDGPVTNNQDPAAYTQIIFPSSGSVTVQNTYPHSIMGGLVVGNYNTGGIETGNAFIYDVQTKIYTTLSIPTALFTSAYGVWYNGGTSYTIVGGYSDTMEAASILELNKAFIVDYDPTQIPAFTHLATYTYNNQVVNYTHFEGITTDGGTGYNLAAGWINGGVAGAAFAHISRTSSGGFPSSASWVTVSYPGSSMTTGNTVYQNYLLGIYTLPTSDQTNGYVAMIPTSLY